MDEQTEAFAEIAEVVENAPAEEETPEDTPVSEGEDILGKYKELYLQNEDMAGWISIDGTTINYPVMQTKNNPNFYLKHNFEKGIQRFGSAVYPRGLRPCGKRQSDYLRTPYQRSKDVWSVGDYKSELL